MTDNFTRMDLYSHFPGPSPSATRMYRSVVGALGRDAVVLLFYVSIKGRIREVFLVASATAELPPFVVILAATPVLRLLVVATNQVIPLIALGVLFRVVFFIRVFLGLLLLLLCRRTAHFDVVHLHL